MSFEFPVCCTAAGAPLLPLAPVPFLWLGSKNIYYALFSAIKLHKGVGIRETLHHLSSGILQTCKLILNHIVIDSEVEVLGYKSHTRRSRLSIRFFVFKLSHEWNPPLISTMHFRLRDKATGSSPLLGAVDQIPWSSVRCHSIQWWEQKSYIAIVS